MKGRKDHQKAFELYLQTANDDYAPGLFQVGLAYEIGRGVEENIDKAMDYYQRAAKLNHTGALYALGLIYEENSDYHDDHRAIEYYQKGLS
ncbi:hypothetical protein SD457_15425 [Coprobacillaceae bacterium CR2/5/TPMF4]|nr:hypothetical protein SD457_15425 [Coprobacillaceae bacterium CR2/5/TPMF4]